jgi:hypothetical protein
MIMTGPRGSDKPELGVVPKAGRTVPKTEEKDEWEPVPNAKHMFKSRITGKFKFTPPEPAIWIPDFFIP